MRRWPVQSVGYREPGKVWGRTEGLPALSICGHLAFAFRQMKKPKLWQEELDVHIFKQYVSLLFLTCLLRSLNFKQWFSTWSLLEPWRDGIWYCQMTPWLSPGVK